METGKNTRNAKRNQFRRKDEKPDVGALLDRQPPFSFEAEIGALGSMMLLPENIDEIATELRADDFYFDANRTLFEHLVDMRNAGKDIDMTLLVERLKDKGDYERIGGAAYVAEVFTRVPNAAHVKYYASIVREKSLVRSVIETTTDILREAYEVEQDESEKLLAQAEEKIFAIGELRNAKSTSGDVKEVLLAAIDRLDAKMRGENPVGLMETCFIHKL